MQIDYTIARGSVLAFITNPSGTAGNESVLLLKEGIVHFSSI